MPTSIFDLAASGITENWILTGVIWLDTLLLNIATIIPPIIIFLLTKLGFKVNALWSSLVSLLILILVLELFASTVFWILLTVCILAIFLTLMIWKRSHKNEE
jgi:predicted membrane protein